MDAPALFDLTGKVAIVTGGATGLGRQIAQGLAESSAAVVVCARDGERCSGAAAELESLGVRALGLACDVRDPASIEQVVSRTVATFGRVDILVNNAGTSWGGAAEDASLASWQKVIDVNLTGAFLFSQAVGRELIRQGEGGKIINIASVYAFRGADPAALDAVGYNASKGGLVALTADLAVKWARHRICVNAIAPGWFPSSMSEILLERSGDVLLGQIPLRRFGGSDDLKGAAVFLAAPASDFVTGITLPVDGGQLAG